MKYRLLFSEYRIKGINYECFFSDSYYNRFKLLYPILLNKVVNSRINALLTEDSVLKVLEFLDSETGGVIRKTFYLWDKEVARYIALHTIFKLIAVEDLLHIILDPYINEIYIDGALKPIYLDHAIFGRLTTPIRLTMSQLKRLLLYIKMRSGELLDFSIGPAKIDINMFEQKLRISIMTQRDTGDLTLNIRKILSAPPYLSLIYNQSARLLLALVIALLVLRPNIVIFGETGSGKTTLASLLIHAMPDKWRIALIEDVAEIPPQTLTNKHAFRVKVLSLEEKLMGKHGLDKNVAILEMLHRTPDVCFVSEIHDKNDAKAMFHAMAAGLRIIATTHARDIDSLFERWFSIYNFPRSWCCLVDIIIHSKRINVGGSIIRNLDSLYVPLCPTDLKDELAQHLKALNDGSMELIVVSGIPILKIESKKSIDCGRVVKAISKVFQIKFRMHSEEDFKLPASLIPNLIKELNGIAKSINLAGGNNPKKVAQKLQQAMASISRILEGTNIRL